MKILLIDPPYTIFTGYSNRYFPVGLSYIGSVLKKNGYDVVIYDVDREIRDTGELNFSEEYKNLENYLKEINNDNHFIWKRILKIVQDYAPDVIGITSMTMKFGSVVKTAKICKIAKPEARVIVGGSHATDWPEICFQSSYIDFCISGEGEESILELLKAIENNYMDFSGINGVSFKNNGKIIIRKLTPYISDLDEYPYPGRKLLLNQDKYSSEDMGVIITSRGCPYNCGFCSHHQKVRYRNLNNVIEEIKYVKEKYKTQQFAIKDDSFTVNRKRTIQFCEMLKKEKLNVNWDCTTRVNLIDDELLDIMQDAGCNTVKVGIETGSERIMEKVNKRVTFKQIKNVARLLNKHKIFWSAYFMYGFPDETKEDMLKTLEFMKELNPPYAGIGLYSPMPNTDLWNQGIELGLIDSDIDINHFFKTNPKNYFFKDYKKRVINMDYKEFIKVAYYLMDEFNKHNTHWIKILKRAWSRRKAYKNDPCLMVEDIKKVFKWILKI